MLGPPDIEATVGLSGGHIFQGECLPDQMWDRRFSPRTPVPGLYLCGAATHPGGSVIAANGRNAAMAVLADFAVWVKMGAPDPRRPAAVKTRTIDIEEERKFWAYQPPRKTSSVIAELFQ